MAQPMQPVIHSEFGVWARRTTLGLLVVIALMLVWVGQKIDRNFEGNPNGGTRQLICALAQDDAEILPRVARVVEEYCP